VTQPVAERDLDRDDRGILYTVQGGDDDEFGPVLDDPFSEDLCTQIDPARGTRRLVDRCSDAPPPDEPRPTIISIRAP
jgi:hypothetical protein